MDAILFNCCTNFEAPNWSDFDALEVGGCTSVTLDDGSTITEGGADHDSAEFWTVYGRCTWGGCEAITDCPTYDAALEVAKRLSVLSGLVLFT